MGVNVSVDFFVSSINGNTKVIQLGSNTLGFTTESEKKLYILDLTEYNQTLLV